MRTARIVAGGRVQAARVEGKYLIAADGIRYEEDQVHWLAPVEPRNVIGLALNYQNHAAELGLDQPADPAIFLKPTSAVIGHRAPIRYPRGASYCHYETELAVVMGTSCRRVSPSQALDYVMGYTVANDFTCRDFVHNTFRPPVRAKGWDTFCPLGPTLITPDEVAYPGRLAITTTVNGELRQQGTTAQMIQPIADIIAYLSEFMTLMPGDVILTGTPEGVSPVRPGDVIACSVEKIGVLTNPVVEEELP